MTTKAGTWHFRPDRRPPQPTSLFDTITLPDYKGAETVREKFDRYHAANPGVYRALVHFAHELANAQRSRGRAPHFSIALLVERVRWEYAIRTVSEDGFKIGNNFKPYYARLIMANEPDLAGVFDLRAMWTDGEVR